MCHITSLYWSFEQKLNHQNLLEEIRWSVIAFEIRVLGSSSFQMFFKIGVLKSSRPEVFREKDVPKNFAILTGKHLCWNILLIKLRPKCLNLIKKRLQHSCYFANIAKFLRTSFLQNTSGQLLLSIWSIIKGDASILKILGYNFVILL